MLLVLVLVLAVFLEARGGGRGMVPLSRRLCSRV